MPTTDQKIGVFAGASRGIGASLCYAPSRLEVARSHALHRFEREWNSVVIALSIARTRAGR